MKSLLDLFLINPDLILDQNELTNIKGGDGDGTIIIDDVIIP